MVLCPLENDMCVKSSIAASPICQWERCGQHTAEQRLPHAKWVYALDGQRLPSRESEWRHLPLELAGYAPLIAVEVHWGVLAIPDAPKPLDSGQLHHSIDCANHYTNVGEICPASVYAIQNCGDTWHDVGTTLSSTAQALHPEIQSQNSDEKYHAKEPTSWY